MVGVSVMYRNCKQKIANYVQALKCLGSKEQKQLLILGMVIGISNLALSLFSIYTLLSLGLFFGAIAGLIAIKVLIIKRNGVINYIPIKYHNVLLNRSIFDMVCDLWFEPKIILYLKAFVLPFLVKLDPAEAVEQFDVFPPHLREKLLTKGLVNLMPGFVREAIAPPAENVVESPSEPSSISVAEEELMEDKYNFGNNSIRERKAAKGNDVLSDTRSTKTTATNSTPPRVIDLTDESNGDPLAPFRNDKNTKAISSKAKTDVAVKTMKNNKVELSKTWDRLEEFIRKHREKIIKERMGLIPPPKTFELKGPLSNIQKLALSLKSTNLLDKLNGKSLTALFLISGVGVMAQMILSKRTRTWTINLLYFLAYAAGITVSSGSFALLLLKLKAKLSKKKAIKAE